MLIKPDIYLNGLNYHMLLQREGFYNARFNRLSSKMIPQKPDKMDKKSMYVRRQMQKQVPLIIFTNYYFAIKKLRGMPLNFLVFPKYFLRNVAFHSL